MGLLFAQSKGSPNSERSEKGLYEVVTLSNTDGWGARMRRQVFDFLIPARKLLGM